MIAVAKLSVTCTMKPFEELRKEIMQKYGEVGVVRFLSSVGTQIEILANPVSGTSTLLEYLPQEKITCILGNGGNTEYNTNLFLLWNKRKTRNQTSTWWDCIII